MDLTTSVPSVEPDATRLSFCEMETQTQAWFLSWSNHRQSTLSCIVFRMPVDESSAQKTKLLELELNWRSVTWVPRGTTSNFWMDCPSSAL